MVTRMIVISTLLAGAASAKEANPPPEGVIEPQADAQLHRMSDYLSSLHSFRVDTASADEKVSTEGQKIQQLKESRVTARRPNGLRVDRRGPAGRVIFRYDGKRFSIDAVDGKAYAIAPAPPTLEAAIDDARERLQIDAPGGDLFVDDPYHALTEDVITGRYIGLEPVGDVMAHHLAMTGDAVDYQIWIQDGPHPVPLRYVITTKDLPGRPEFTLELRNWQPNVTVDDATLAFTPPPGARQMAFARPNQPAPRKQ